VKKREEQQAQTIEKKRAHRRQIEPEFNRREKRPGQIGGRRRKERAREEAREE
jgi:hypothetical protein